MDGAAVRRQGVWVWSGADSVLLRNIRFLGAGRRPRFIDAEAAVKVDEMARSGMSITQVEKAAGVDRRDARAAVLALLWSGAWTTNLAQPLSGQSVISRAAERN